MIGVLPGVMGLIQATETIKLILGIGHSLVGRLLLFDAFEMRFTEMKLERDPSCPVCGDEPSINELIDYEQFCGVKNTGNGDSDTHDDGAISPYELVSLLSRREKPLVIDVREPYEWEICHLSTATLIPEKNLRNRLRETDRSKEIVLYCRTGVRSSRAVNALRAMGFNNVRSLEGGINRWSDEVDPSIPKY